MNNLNVFRIIFMSSNKIVGFFKALKYSFQRITKGYCDMDTWNLDLFYLTIMKNTLDNFVINTQGWPGQMYNTFEEFITDIIVQIDKLQYVLSDEDKENEYYEEYSQVLLDTRKLESTKVGNRIYWDLTPEQEELSNKCYQRSEEIHAEHCKVRNEVIDWLKHHWEYLWW